MLKRRDIQLSIAVTGDEPPSEFRIFTAGEVDTTKGRFVFDEAAAAAVMAEYTAHGIDLMIDYDHASLASLSLDPAAAGKAAGWFNLEVRAGELWAVNVRWTPPAAAALRAKEWRFMSPAFRTDGDRIAQVLNVAITNMPATRQLEPLMAASDKGAGMSVEEFLKVCKALDIDMSSSLEEAMAKIKGEAKEEEPASPEEPAAPEAAALADAPPAATEEEEKPAEVAAALSSVLRLSGKQSFVEALADIKTWHASHVKLETETQKLAAERQVLESAERRKLCVELVSLGGRAPSTVWADDKSTSPKTYLSTMPLADLRAMHADAIKANGGRKAPKTPIATESDDKEFATSKGLVTLSASELRECERAGAKPEVFAEQKADRAARAKGKV